MDSILAKEVLKCLKRNPITNSWELIEPHLLYLSPVQSNAYLKAMNSQKYSTGFHSDTIEIIRANCAEIVGKESLCLIDLGPGYPDKALPMGEYCKRNGIALHYVPIDVSDTFLEIAEKEMKPFCVKTSPVHSMFETSAIHLREVDRSCSLAMIGLTFMNFPPEVFLPLLKAIAGPSGRGLVASELRSEEGDMKPLLARYEIPEARNFGFGPLELLGLSQDDVSFRVEFNQGRIELRFKLLSNIPEVLNSKSVAVGDEVVTAVSYRYTENELNYTLEKHFSRHQIFKSVEGNAAVAVCSV